MVPRRISSPSFPPFPHPQEPVAHRSPHGLRPGKDGLEATLRAAGPGRGRAPTCGRWRQVSAAGSATCLAPRPGRPRLPRCCRGGGSVQPWPGSGRSPRRRTASGILRGSRGAPASESPGGFQKAPEPGPRAHRWPRAEAGGPGSLHSQRAARAASQARAVLSSAERGCGRLCGGRGRPAAPCGASRPPPRRPWPLPGRTPREGTARIPDPRVRALHLLSHLDNFPSQEDPVLERYFKGHKAAITSLDFSPNGKHLGKLYSRSLFYFFPFCDGQRSAGWTPCLLSTPGPRGTSAVPGGG